MHFCQFKGCKEPAPESKLLCPTHQQELIKKAERHLSPEDSQFLLDHLNGCTIDILSEYLKVRINTINHFLLGDDYRMNLEGLFLFLIRQHLIRILLHKNVLIKYEKDLAKLKAVREAQSYQSKHALLQKLVIELQALIQNLEAKNLHTHGQKVKSSQSFKKSVKNHRKRYGGYNENEYTARNISNLFHNKVSATTIRAWMKKGYIPFREITLNNGRIVMVVKREDLIDLVQNSFGKKHFSLYSIYFREFLHEHTNLEIPYLDTDIN